MRVLAAILLIGAVLAAGCEEASRTPEPSTPTTWIEEGGFRPGPPPTGERGWPQNILTIPAGFPDEGLDPCHVWGTGKDGVWVVGTGTVDRILRDDTKAPRHQRFVIRVCSDSGPTLLFAHNIDVAPRVPFHRGDTLAFRGMYERNDQGGVVHWTHRDKRDKKAGGWIIWKGQNFR